MLTAKQKEVSLDRLIMALVGAAAGVSLWLFVDILPDLLDNARLLMFSTALVMGFFAIMMALSGPARLTSAALAAAGLALPSALLLLWASFRYDNIGDFLQTGHIVAVFLVLVGISTPFIAAALHEKSGWKRYSLLFDISWIIVVRYAASWLFVAVFWGVLMLSDALLEMVGITIIETLLEIDWMPYVLTGTVLGLALSVVHELSEYVSPFLILRLLRLLLPIVLLVVGVFIVALPFRGLSGLFGNLSSAATLMAMAWGGITLVTTALDKSDEDAVGNTPMQLMTKALAVLLPVLSALSLYAVWLRIDQYGLTPDRIAAAMIALFILAYSLAYVVAVVRRHNWMADIRSANRIMAMALIGVSALWLSPAVNVEKMSTNNQIARFQSGLSNVETLALWEMSNEWGRAGQAGLEHLRALVDHPDYAALIERADKATSASSKYAFNRNQITQKTANQRAELRTLIAVRPVGTEFPAAIFDTLHTYQISQLISGCGRPLPDGRKGCVAVIAPFNPALNQPQGMFIFLSAIGVEIYSFGMRGDTLSVDGQAVDLATGDSAKLGPDALMRLLDGNFTLEPANLQALHVGGIALIPDN